MSGAREDSMKNRIRDYVAAVLGICLLVGADQWTKWLAVTYLKGKDPLVVVEGILEFYYYENRGAAFGTMQGMQILFYIITPVILALVAWFFTRLPREKRFWPFRIFSVVLAAGAVGNFIDRIVHQYVIDFIYVVWIDFPIFNVADCYITVSAIFLIILYLFYYKDADMERIFPSKKKKHQKEE